MLHQSPWSPICVGNEPRWGTHLPWLRQGYITSILVLRRKDFRLLLDYKGIAKALNLNTIDP